ncbi:MAG: hypothetical protein AVDCRST_MAG69-2357 [uncultured Solirubrobacteraceae bacterium]|uniref:Uncharacterized protein n=1 Tax=uncultured Solirubrobacteraceae bacterium TaxID=1162706 RepID=A0A6J4SXY6_9ACTN|nr:MAG: hypothetical protein AVDCRST_MAG69-2357 [uncultured Solirubrobacteraceae bacterium]
MNGLSVCLCTESRNPSGLGRHMLDLAVTLQGHGHAPILISPSTDAALELRDLARVAGIPNPSLPGERGDVDHLQLAAFLTHAQVDVFHCHAGIAWEGHDCVQTARDAGVPAVVRTEHLPWQSRDQDDRVRYLALSSRVDRFIHVSEQVADTFAAAALRPETASVVRNGIIAARSRTATEVATRFFDDPRARTVLTVARLTPRKGHIHLIKALPVILEADVPVHLLLAGDGPQRQELEQLSRDLGVGRNVHFLGHRRDIPALLEDADVFVLPSLYEGLPLVVLEAMASKTPVVATDIVGTGEAVIDGVTGRLVAPSDPLALADAILDVLADSSRAARWASAGYRRYWREFTADRMTRETVAVYRAAIEPAVPAVVGGDVLTDVLTTGSEPAEAGSRG